MLTMDEKSILNNTQEFKDRILQLFSTLQSQTRTGEEKPG
jgi:hypothetical protein